MYKRAGGGGYEAYGIGPDGAVADAGLNATAMKRSDSARLSMAPTSYSLPATLAARGTSFADTGTPPNEHPALTRRQRMHAEAPESGSGRPEHLGVLSFLQRSHP